MYKCLFVCIIWSGRVYRAKKEQEKMCLLLSDVSFQVPGKLVGQESTQGYQQNPQLVIVPLWPGSRWNSTLVSGQYLLMCVDKIAKNVRQAKETLWQESVSVQNFPPLSLGKGFLFLKNPSLARLLPKHHPGASPSPLECMGTDRHLTQQPRRCHSRAKCGSSGSPVTRGVL